MKTIIRGSIAAAALCALLAACGGSDSPAPTVLPASVAITSNARADAGANVTFATDVSTTTGLTFRWDFGDGSTGAGATTSHAYAKPGTYQVTLAVANDAEDLRTSTSTIEVGAYANVTGLVCSQADSAGWCWQHAIVMGHQINDVFFVDATHAFAVGDGLTILKSTDGAHTWSPVALDATLPVASLQHVRFYDSMHGLALDDRGGALRTTDGGSTWSAISLGGTVYGGATTFVDYRASRIILQSVNSGQGTLSLDGGDSWSTIAGYGPIQATSTDCWTFAYNSAERAAGCGSTLTTTLPSFLTNGSSYFAAGAFASDTQGLVVGSGISYDSNYSWVSWAWATSDGGQTWAPFTPNGLPPYYYYGLTLQMIDPQAGLLYVPSGLTAFTTADGGHNWTALTSSPALTQVYSYYQATGLIGNGVLWQASGNRVSISADRGLTWHDSVLHAEDAAALAGTAGAAAVTQYTDANDFLVAINHRFYLTSDGGQTFRQVLGADSRDAGSAFAAGEFSDIHNGKFLTSNGALLSTADGGRTWTRLDYPNSSGTPVALHFTSASEGWLVLGGKLAHSTDSGATWSTPLVGSAMINLQGMSWGDAKHGWAWNNTLYVTSDAGATWAAASLPDNMAASFAVMTGPLSGVATNAYGDVAMTQDGGATWQTGNGQHQFGPLVAADAQTVWSLPLGGGLLRSKDGGRNWQAAGPALANGAPSSLVFADSLHGWLVTNNGGVFRTIDGGDSWTAQPVGSDLVLDAVVAADARTAWIITRDGQILSTATAGE